MGETHRMMPLPIGSFSPPGACHSLSPARTTMLALQISVYSSFSSSSHFVSGFLAKRSDPHPQAARIFED